MRELMCLLPAPPTPKCRQGAHIPKVVAQQLAAIRQLGRLDAPTVYVPGGVKEIAQAGHLQGGCEMRRQISQSMAQRPQPTGNAHHQN